jgi:putative ABC transport system permease protein
MASPDYFKTLGVAVKSGRPFARADRTGAPNVCIVNETFVRRYLGDADPLQQKLTFDHDTYSIVGVVADVRRWGKAQDAVPETYFPAWQGANDTMSVVLRTNGDPMALAGALRAAVQSVDPSQAVYAVKSMNEIVFEAASLRRFEAMLFAVFGAIALVLASLGIYGVMTYHVSQRSQEMGIRMALGARATQIVAMVVGEGMALCGVGLAIGLVAAVALSALLQALLFGVGGTDAVSYIAAGGVLAAVAFAACWLPARRATRVDPIAALRAS